MLRAHIMFVRGRSVWPVVLCLGLLALLRGQYALTSAFARWPATAWWDNPQTLELSDINSLVSVTLPYVDPVREARGWLITGLPRAWLVVPKPTDAPVHDLVRPSTFTRAPPAA